MRKTLYLEYKSNSGKNLIPKIQGKHWGNILYLEYKLNCGENLITKVSTGGTSYSKIQGENLISNNNII